MSISGTMGVSLEEFDKPVGVCILMYRHYLGFQADINIWCLYAFCVSILYLPTGNNFFFFICHDDGCQHVAQLNSTAECNIASAAAVITRCRRRNPVMHSAPALMKTIFDE